MTSSAPNRSRRKIIYSVVGVVAVLIVAFAAFAVWFLREDAPDRVSIDDAAAQLTDNTPATDADSDTDADADTENTADGTDTEASTEPGTDTEDPATDGISGTWNVDTSIGEFSYEDSTGTFVGFRIAEELAGVGSTEAVGRTPEVAGTLVVDGTETTGIRITEVTIEADMTAITTNERRRDDKVQDALDTGAFPTATFVLTQPIEIDESALAGATISVDATGDLTIHGVTKSVTIPLDAQLVGDTIVVVGSLDISFGDFGVSVPSAPVVLSAEDHGPLELQLFFTR